MKGRGPYTPRRRCLITRMASPPGKPDSCPKVLIRLAAVFAGLAWAVSHLLVRVHRKRK